MCLILLSWQARRDVRLIVAANRDEFLARPTDPAHFWPDAPMVFGGRDREFGGSWMGLSRRGRFAAVTNLRQQAHTGERSRGHLVKAFLSEDRPAARFFAELESTKFEFRPFNFIASDGNTLLYTDNVKPGWQPLAPGEHAIGNVPRQQESRKRQRGLKDFRDCIADHIDAAALLAMLTNREISEPHDDPKLQALSQRFVTLPGYGTRTSSIIIMKSSGDSVFWEQNYDHNQQPLPLEKHIVSGMPGQGQTDR